MTITAQDIVSLTTARAQLSELAEQVKAGAEKIITKNGERAMWPWSMRTDSTTTTAWSRPIFTC